MTDLGAQFINLRQQQPAGADVTATLAGLIEMITAGDPTMRWVIYLPPGEYEVAVDRGGLRVPSNVTVWFAPGAMLLPIAEAALGGIIPPSGSVFDPELGSHVAFAGPLRAGLQAIFPTAATHPSRTLGGVRLEMTDETPVFPEWWGAARNAAVREPSVDTAAIQAAVQAAITARPTQPLPVWFSGTYQINAPLILDGLTPGTFFRPATVAQEAVLGGSGLSGGAVTFQWVGAIWEAPLWTLRNVPSLRLSGLSIDGAERVSSLLRVEPDSAGTSARSILIERCHASGARHDLVVLHGTDDPGDPRPVRVEFDECTFQPAAEHHPSSGVRVDGVMRAEVAFRACAFEGRASAMILARTGTLDMSGCRFHNADVTLEPYSASELPRGVDLVLDNTAVETRIRPTFAVDQPRRFGGPTVKDSLVFWDPVLFDTILLVDVVRLEPASATLRACHSASATVVFQRSHGPSPRVERDTTLCAVVHAIPLPAALAVLPPSVFWADAVARPLTLNLTGCRLGDALTGARVVLGAGRQTVFQLATTHNLDATFLATTHPGVEHIVRILGSSASAPGRRPAEYLP